MGWCRGWVEGIRMLRLFRASLSLGVLINRVHTRPRAIICSSSHPNTRFGLRARMCRKNLNNFHMDLDFRTTVISNTYYFRLNRSRSYLLVTKPFQVSPTYGTKISSSSSSSIISPCIIQVFEILRLFSLKRSCRYVNRLL